MPERWISIENKTGRPYHLERHVITPFSQVITVRIPGLNGGLVWSRPLSVLVDDGAGQEAVHPVTDVTRQAQWALFGAAITFPLLAWLLAGRRRSG